MRVFHKFLRWGIFGLLVLSGYACKRGGPTPAQNNNTPTVRVTPRSSIPVLNPKQQALQQKAVEVIASTFQSLSGQLRQAVAKGGISQAVHICSTQAIPLTEAAGKKFNARIARVSHRPRNLNNTANTQELQIIHSYVADLGKGNPVKPIVLEKTGYPTVVYAPILLIMPLCLQCHGTVGKDIKEADYTAIKKLYPQDQAINFKMGEVRGLWKVSFAQTAPEPARR